LAQAIRALETIPAGSPSWHQIDTAKFHATVPPGACLDLTVTRSASGRLQLNIFRGSELTASVRFR
jgi:3-hydroxymyristoyl/3-hydroxydecanoyl-(acyl carrier protein) dehydratase